MEDILTTVACFQGPNCLHNEFSTILPADLQLHKCPSRPLAGPGRENNVTVRKNYVSCMGSVSTTSTI